MSRNPKRERKGTIPLSNRHKHNPRIGRCYELSAQALTTRHPTQQPLADIEDWVMVHGRPRLTIPPFEKYGHSWLEKYRGTDKAFVFDPVADVFTTVNEYYEAGEIDPEDNMFVYTRQQALDIMETSNHWGPWEGIEAPPLMMPTGDEK